MSDIKTYQNILAIDGSTPICTVALRVGDRITVMQEIGMGIHSSAIFTQILELLSVESIHFNQINAVVIGIGPGSYTGLRVVASSIKGLLFHNKIPTFGINTLAGFAACSVGNSKGTIHSIIDARRNHLYHQTFNKQENGVVVAASKPELIEIPDLYQSLKAGDVLIGTGIERLDAKKLTHIEVKNPDQITASGLIAVFQSHFTTPSDLVEAIDPADFEPKYAIEDFT